MDEFARLFGPEDYVRRYANTVHDRTYDRCTATLKVWRASLKRVIEQGKNSGIDTSLLDPVDDLWSRAEAAGYGEEHGMAMFKIMRDPGA